jgi:hypothetical protein
VFEPDLRPHLLEAVDVQVDRTLADRAPAGERHPRLAKAREQRAQHEDRRAHRLDEVVRGFVRPQARHLDRRAPAPLILDRRPELLEHAQHRADVADEREVVDRDALFGEERRREDGERRVLAPSDRDTAGERASADDPKLVHGGAL